MSHGHFPGWDLTCKSELSLAQLSSARIVIKLITAILRWTTICVVCNFNLLSQSAPHFTQNEESSKLPILGKFEMKFLLSDLSSQLTRHTWLKFNKHVICLQVFCWWLICILNFVVYFVVICFGSGLIVVKHTGTTTRHWEIVLVYTLSFQMLKV